MDAVKLAEQALNEAKALNEAAQNSDWQKVTEIQNRLEQTVNQVDILEVPAEFAPVVRKILIQARDLNKESEQLANRQKDSLVQEKQTMTKANKMQKALDALK